MCFCFELRVFIVDCFKRLLFLSKRWECTIINLLYNLFFSQKRLSQYLSQLADEIASQPIIAVSSSSFMFGFPLSKQLIYFAWQFLQNFEQDN
jgi:hypothetical protein